MPDLVQLRAKALRELEPGMWEDMSAKLDAGTIEPPVDVLAIATEVYNAMTSIAIVAEGIGKLGIGIDELKQVVINVCKVHEILMKE